MGYTWSNFEKKLKNKRLLVVQETEEGNIS